MTMPARNRDLSAILPDGNEYEFWEEDCKYAQTLYVDGSQVSSCEHNNAYNQHWKLTTGALYFADNDGEEKAIATSEIRFWNVALDHQQAAKLGGVPTE